jgi:peptidylprolyl isomerase
MRFLSMILGIVLLAATAHPALAKTYEDPENTLLMELKDGTVVIQLRPDYAPKHVARIKELTRQGFYDGVVFHRVIAGFMAQTGDPTGTGTGGSGQKMDGEFGNSAKFVRGTLGMANAGPGTDDSQFFITYAPTPHLVGLHTIFGQVISGMEYVEAIKKGTDDSGMVENPDKIISLKVAADVAEPAAAE